jgi:integrase
MPPLSKGHLTPFQVAELVRAGERRKHSDGAGLYLAVRGRGRGYWIKQFRKNGVLSAAGKPAFGSACLGSWPTMSLAAARVERGRFDPTKPVEQRRPARAVLAHSARPVVVPPFAPAGAPRPPAKPVEHHAFLPFRKVPKLVALLRGDTERPLKARCLQFMFLTGVRVTAACSIQWKQIDLETKVWTMPANLRKVKTRGDFRAPLSDAAIACLGEPAKSGPVFGLKRNAMNEYLDRWMSGEFMADDGRKPVPHGFRSTFGGWAEDRKDDHGFGYDIVLFDMALDHMGKGKITRSYMRSDRLADRRKLMDAWAAFATGS